MTPNTRFLSPVSEGSRVSSYAVNADQQSSIKTDTRAKINIARRQANRALNTERLLALLRRETPEFFELFPY
jgi:hypothetical protein